MLPIKSTDSCWPQYMRRGSTGCNAGAAAVHSPIAVLTTSRHLRPLRALVLDAAATTLDTAARTPLSTFTSELS
jgi:hypothetical protein